jgi:small subunit ribosomal protein S21
MLRIVLKPNESIDRALKRYKQKFRRTKVKEQLQDSRYYTKRSQQKRETLKKAVRKDQYLREMEE